jgi:hypothetical protein
VSRGNGWVPLIGIALAYPGVVVALGVLSLLSTPEFEHATYLHLGLVALAWSVLAAAGIGISVASLRRTSIQLRPGFRVAVVALNVPIGIGLALALPVSIWSLNDYRAGFAAYDAAAQRCGDPPVLAWSGYWGHYVLPSDSDYDRLKYTAPDPSINGPMLFFCSAADAEAAGIHHFGIP